MTTFTAFTDAQWEEIQAARADWPTDINWEMVRQSLEQAGRDFWTMRANRRRRLPKDARTILRRALKHVRVLERDLAELRIKHTLIGLKRGLENRLTIYEMSGRFFEGRADAHRELLYMRAIQQWAGPLKGELKVSRRDDGTADGPTVRYVGAVLAAVLGDETPGRAGIAKIIRKEEKRRREKKWQRRNNDTLNAKNNFKV
ncbi:MAG TPA: hypothetical protein VMS82_09350 [Pseudolabrys sp.]|nr:hypothetical protein [Pseudolabrys sp.]